MSRAVASGVKGSDNSKIPGFCGAPWAVGAPQNPGILLYRPMFCE